MNTKVSTKGAVKRRPKRQHTPRSPIDKARGDELDWDHASAIFHAARVVGNPCFVYFIGEPDDGPLKIGVAKDPIARLRNMQTGNPRRLRIERVLLGDMPVEKLLHEIWEDFAIVAPAQRGKPGAPPWTEWFGPEIREPLFPVIDTAAVAQVKILTRGEGEIDINRLEHVVRVAHTEHGVELRVREEVRLLAAGGGYVRVGRRSRV